MALIFIPLPRANRCCHSVNVIMAERTIMRVLSMPTPSPLYCSLGVNQLGRDYAVGDIHGEFELLEYLLEKSGFNKKKDRLIPCGDTVDRGTQSHRLADFYRQPWFKPIRGNHEEFCLYSGHGKAVPAHEHHGGKWWNDLSYSSKARLLNVMNSMPIAMDLMLSNGSRVGFVHAEVVVPDWDLFVSSMLAETDPMDSPMTDMALWGTSRMMEGKTDLVTGIDVLYVGHFVQKSPRILGNTHFIDTGCGYFEGVLTLVDLLTKNITRAAIIEGKPCLL